MTAYKPKISIVTPSYNQASYLEQTIYSVLNQRYDNLEYIVIDGGSNDASIEIIRRYEQFISHWVSEPDRGQVHALNKGLEKCTGEIFAFLNSDDVYLPGAFSAVIDYFHVHPECSWVCGDSIMFGEGHPTKLFKAIVPKSAVHALTWQSHAPQPGMFWRRDLLLNGFDEKWNYCFDHEFYVRLLLTGYKCEHLPLPLAAYRLHSTSKTVAESNKFDQEFDRIAEKYEPILSWSDRRWCVSTRYLRKSIAGSQRGNMAQAAKWIGRAISIHPESIFRRPFWGVLRKMFSHTILNPNVKDY